MRRLAFAVLTLFSFALAAPASASSDAAIADELRRYFAIRTDMGAFSGSVLVAREGKVIFRRGYGYADLARRARFTPETKHEVASISKMFTAMAALKLRDDGKLKLDDSICIHLSNCPATWNPITVEQLMHHTSGIPDYESRLRLGSPQYLDFMKQGGASLKIYEEAKTLPLDFAPGTKFNYSNTGYIVLSHLIEETAGEPFERFVVRRLLRPAGMKHSGVLGARRPRGLAKGYTHADWGWERTLAGVSLTDGDLQEVPLLPLTSPEGDAWLYSTVDDLYRWSQVMDGSPLVPKGEVEEVFAAGLEGYGYGWFVGKGFGRNRVRHNGQLPGYLSDFIKFPDDRITIVLLSNLDKSPLMHIARDVTSIVLGVSMDFPQRGKVVRLNEEEYAAVEGAYLDAKRGERIVVTRNGKYLKARLGDDFTADLIPLGPTLFFFPLTDGRAMFTIGDEGRAVRLNLRYSGEDHVAERLTE